MVKVQAVPMKNPPKAAARATRTSVKQPAAFAAPRATKAKKVVMSARKPAPIVAAPSPKVAKPSKSTPDFRLKRNRVQTKLYQAPDTTVPESAKSSSTSRVKKPVPKKTKKTTVIAPTISKARKITKKEAAREKAKQIAKKGNERLKKRDGIKVNKENSFFAGSAPDFISVNTYHRWLIRALLKKNITELKAVVRSKKLSADSFENSFCYADGRNPDDIARQTGDHKFIEEYYKLKDAVLKEKKFARPEPNMLQRKTTGQRNFYMLGRATRVLHMSRGGREGNNAFLDYEQSVEKDHSSGIQALVEKNTLYQEIHRLGAIKESHIQPYALDVQLVNACRRGHTDLAYAIASSEAQHCTNELQRLTLKKGGKLPAKILGVSILKKCFGNKNITPLHTAAINPDGAKMLEQMRAVDPNINVADQDGWYTVHYAAVCSTAEPLRYLLKNGAVPTMLNKRQQSPLHVAAIAGRDETVKVLMEAIAKLERGDGGEEPKAEKSLVNARTRDGDTALLLAVRHGHLNVVKALLENEKIVVDTPSSATTNKITPLMLACSKGFLDIAQLLVSKDALVEAKDKKKRTPLIHAVLNGQEHTAAYLLSLGADHLKGDSSGNTAAHYAAAYGWLHCLQLLADVDPVCLSAENDWKITPLTVAFLKGHYGVVTWLLDGKYKDHVDINGKDMEGYTLLSCLLSFTDPELHHELPEQIDYLLQRGADCTLTDSVGNTILHDFAALPVQINKTTSKHNKQEKEIGMTEAQYRGCFEKLCDKAPDAITAKNQEQNTPMHVALKQGNLLLFNWFLEKVDDPKEFLTQSWTMGNTFLETLLNLPLDIWKGPLWNGETKPPSALYDVLPLIKDPIMKYCKAETENWLRSKNTVGVDNVLVLAEKYAQLAPTGRTDEDEKPFVDYVSSIFSWIIDVFPETLTLKTEADKNHTAGTLLFFSLCCRIEKGRNVLLQSLLQKATQYKLLGKVLCEEIVDIPLTIHALQMNTSALKAILDFSAKENCTDGVHNAVLKTIKEEEDDEEKVVTVNKTLLMMIIERNEFDLVANLVLSPKEWKAKDADGNSAWHHAAKSSHHRTLVLMKNLEAKKVPRETNNRGATPLHVAVQASNGSANSVLEPIEWLVTKSNVADQDVFGRTAMHYAFGSFSQLAEKQFGAVQKDPIAVVSILAMNITEKDLNLTDVDGNTALHLAAAAGANICAVTLLRKGAKVDVVNKDGNTPLALAVLKARQAVALTLIQANSCVTDKVVIAKNNVKGKKEEEKWVWKALLEEQYELITDSSIPAQIVKRGTDWAAMVYVLLDTLGKNTKSLAQITTCALKEEQYNLANQLLKSLEALLDGSPLEAEEDLVLVFAKNLSADTSMDEESVERTVADRLLNLGCPLVHDGTCPAFEVALENSAWNLASYLKENMISAWSRLKPVKEGEGPLHALLTGGELKDEEYSTWMQELMGLKQLKATTCSLNLPTPPDFKDHVEGPYTALGWAALSANIPLIKFLRAKGFDVNAADERGRTPLMMAVLSNSGATLEALCGDLVAARKHVPHKKGHNAVHTTTHFARHLVSMKARKRKIDDDEEDDDEDEDENSEESEEEENSSDNEEDNNNGHKQPLAKRFKIANKQLLLDAKDNNGRNIFHYFCEPIAWENVEIFKLLVKEAKPATKKLLGENDNNGVSPPVLAAKLKLRMMSTAMSQVTGQKLQVPTSDLPSVDDLETEYDVTADSKAFMEKFAAENDKKNGDKKEEEEKPCKLSGYRDSGIVEKCNETGQYYRVLLNKSDLTYGRFGFHNFYRMELIKRRDADLWNLFTNWGRIGAGDGEFQSTPFGSLEAGVKEFKSVFKSKTGQDWLHLDQFVDQPKKYRLVKVDTSPSSLAEVELPADGSGKDKEEKDVVRAFVKDISDPRKLKQYQKGIYRQIHASCPFGRVTSDTIQHAREILEDCKMVAKKIQEELNSKGPQERLLRLINQANDLSSEYYSVIPIASVEFSALTRLDDENLIREAEISLNRMTEIEIAARILTGAANRPDVDRINYISSAIECGIRAMTPDESMSQNILQWIHTTSYGLDKVSVKGILEITPMRSVKDFAKFANDDHQRFLFHGTRATNLVSLLRDGFIVDPTHAQINGRLFGDGIYMADFFEKSNSYCDPSGRDWKYMFVCQVALGKMAEGSLSRWEEVDLTKGGYHSLHMKGTKHPKHFVTIDGISMPLGASVKPKDNAIWCQMHSEYIVKDPQRILPRFIVMYK